MRRLGRSGVFLGIALFGLGLLLTFVKQEPLGQIVFSLSLFLLFLGVLLSLAQTD